ncbi:hypothetical protein diail_8349 [Diaporthe ilicicola]|nr:hypothetical protein diail_8349 [Diaporthe ilicicola]
MPEQDQETEQAVRLLDNHSGEQQFNVINEGDDELLNVWLSSSAMQSTPTDPLNPGWTDWATSRLPENPGSEITASAGTELQSTELQLLSVDMNMRDHRLVVPTEPMILAEDKDTVMTEYMRAELDQVYFDRVHPILPIIYRRRYFSWADQHDPGPIRTCLRSAMRTIAAAMSAPGRRYCDQLYVETSRLLQIHMVGSKDKIVLEYLQALLLLGHYELLRVGDYQAMLTAGRCFRLLLMARLSDIDLPGHGEMNLRQLSSIGAISDEGLTEGFPVIEERRRVFWAAFCLDRLLCSRNDYPLILQEEMISVRLPAPEVNFQQNQPIRTCYLSEAISASQHGPALSAFTECYKIAMAAQVKSTTSGRVTNSWRPL